MRDDYGRSDDWMFATTLHAVGQHVTAPRTEQAFEGGWRGWQLIIVAVHTVNPAVHRDFDDTGVVIVATWRKRRASS